MPREFGIVGVPSSAGAHWPGQEKAPRALREAGLLERLRAAGCDLVDHGDLPTVRWQATPGQRRPHNREAVVAVARAVAERVEGVLRAGHRPLVLGGDCSITVGVVAGFLRAGADPALLYVDGGGDLFTPATYPTGMMDAMGVAHLIGEEGTDAELAGIGPRSPLMAPERIVYFGFDDEETQGAERAVLERRPMPRYPAATVHGRSGEAARAALAEVESLADRFVVHFDVDVIQFVDFPLADVPVYQTPVTFAEAMASLAVFAASPRFAGLVVTELNPDHADEEGTLVAFFAERLAAALAPSPAAPGD
jgi:arginase